MANCNGVNIEVLVKYYSCHFFVWHAQRQGRGVATSMEPMLFHSHDVCTCHVLYIKVKTFFFLKYIFVNLSLIHPQ